MKSIRVFSGRSNLPLAEKICAYLGLPLGRVGLDNFPDGEISLKLHEDVRGNDVFVVQSTCTPVNDHLMELLIFIDCLKQFVLMLNSVINSSIPFASRLSENPVFVNILFSTVLPSNPSKPPPPPDP